MSYIVVIELLIGTGKIKSNIVLVRGSSECARESRVCAHVNATEGPRG